MMECIELNKIFETSFKRIVDPPLSQKSDLFWQWDCCIWCKIFFRLFFLQPEEFQRTKNLNFFLLKRGAQEDQWICPLCFGVLVLRYIWLYTEAVMEQSMVGLLPAPQGTCCPMDVSIKESDIDHVLLNQKHPMNSAVWSKRFTWSE